ncbi:MAG TPA: hypothetical protein VKP65_17685 [Rhodothermales bacterium]|nr:hypothetical protein [Rhodothermales bacterium]
MFAYNAFGLRILSELCLPELLPGSGGPDVIINCAEVSDTLDEITSQRVCYAANARRSLFCIPGVAKYLIEEDSRISVDPATGADIDAVRFFLLGPVMGALLYRRGFLVLQGSCVEVQGAGVLFLGLSGTGTSTLAAACMMQGHRVLADDFCAVSFASSDKEPEVVPGYPQLKLRPNTVKQINKDVESEKGLRPGLEKYAIPLGEQFCDHRLPIKQVFYLSSRGSRFSVDVLHGREGFMGLMRTTFHASIIQELWGESKHFMQCIKVAEHASMYRLEVSAFSSHFTLSQLTKLLADTLS